MPIGLIVLSVIVLTAVISFVNRVLWENTFKKLNISNDISFCAFWVFMMYVPGLNVLSLIIELIIYATLDIYES